MSFHSVSLCIMTVKYGCQKIWKREYGTFNLSTNKILNVINGIGHDIGWLVWYF